MPNRARKLMQMFRVVKFRKNKMRTNLTSERQRNGTKKMWLIFAVGETQILTVRSLLLMKLYFDPHVHIHKVATA